MKTKTLTLTPTQIADLKKQHAHALFRYDIPYSQFQVKGSDYTITVYTSGKVVFQGDALELLVAPYETLSKPFTPMAGSDEVGTGDYFGPVTVCACIVTEKNYTQLPVDKIMDSKSIQDSVILSLAPRLMEILDYSLLILDNQKYNHVHETQSMNVIKAKLHNQAYLNLSKKAKIPELAVVDQFTPKHLYLKSLRSVDEIYEPLHFETKAENKYLAVACASIIARYAFLDCLKKMGTHYNVEFPKGAGAHVDSFGIAFIEKFGVNTLNKVAKVHFKNTERITQNA